MASTTTFLPPTETQIPPAPENLHGRMAASQDQLALTKTSRAGAMSTSTRQAVPAFLNKLYNMVSNPENDELVRWSEEGDSFYIPSHERLSKELLPRFFKHGNFSSFVRQLNMYGFHKVPHLQQGVLQNSTESELWQFQNPHFQRGQPDLLCLITRKKTGGNADMAIDDAQHNNHVVGPSGGSAHSNSSSGPLDMTVLTSSLSAIKKHQTSLSAELKALQDSNQHLWNEALAARDRHKKHQDTINKILKFLASVFGNGAAGSPSPGPGGNSSSHRDGSSSPGALVPRKRPRLMIESGHANRDEDEDFAHFTNDDHEMLEARISEAPSDAAPSPTPVPDPRPAGSMGAKSEPPPTPSLLTPSLLPQAIPLTPNTLARRSTPQSASSNQTNPAESQSQPQPDPQSQPQSQPHFDPNDPHAQDALYQETISKLLSSPSTLQRILATLSSAGPDSNPHAIQSEIGPYYGPSNGANGMNNMGGMMNGLGAMMNLPSPDGLDPAIAYNAARLNQATEAVGADLEVINHDLNALMRDWGISPDMLQEHGADLSGFEHANLGADTHPDTNAFVPPAPGTLSQPYASIAPEGDAHVDIDSFLNQFEFPDDTHHTDEHAAPVPASFPVSLPAQFDLENPGPQPQSTAFLDEVHPVPSAASDTSLSPAIPLLDDFGAGTGIGTGTTLGVAGTTVPGATKFVATTPPPPKRGKKRRSVEAASLGEESTPAPIRSTRNK